MSNDRSATIRFSLAFSSSSWRSRFISEGISLLVLFITRIQRNLRARDAQSAEEDHIVRMGLLASGAAHELGTPLSTVLVILSDWQQMPMFNSDPAIAEELRDMLGQLDRCKAIVSAILTSSGATRGEGTVRTTVNEFLGELVEEWSAAAPPRPTISIHAASTSQSSRTPSSNR